MAFVSTFVSILSCSSQFNGNKSSDSGTPQLTDEQRKQQVAELSPRLQGEWVCNGSAVSGMDGCFAEILTFNAALDDLSIQNNWKSCRMSSDYQLVIGTTDSSGMTDFTIHSKGLGQPIGNSGSSADCKELLDSLSTNPLSENYSFTHNADWSQITIGESTFVQHSIQPRPSPAPSSSAN
jgi:hypothetical protein